MKSLLTMLIIVGFGQFALAQIDPLENIANSLEMNRLERQWDRDIQRDMQADKTAALGSYAFGLERQSVVMQQRIAALEKENGRLQQELSRQNTTNTLLIAYVTDILKAFRAKDERGLERALLGLNRGVDPRNRKQVTVKVELK